ncbi:MAG: DUF1592 domain-containing protein, partial [Verrucomicrobiota bacterium]
MRREFLNARGRLPRVSFFLVFAVLTAALDLAAAEQKRTFTRDIQPLLDQYCYKCHGPTKPKGGVNLQQFKDETGVWRDPRLWQTALAQLRERAMPPEGKPQPTPEERDRLIEWVDHKLDNLEQGEIPKDPGRVVLHRLSRFEYNNTIRDLFGVDSRPADKFPADGGGGAGFDNNASTLFIPPILMEKYLAAADDILNEANPQRTFVARPGGFTSKRSAARKIVEHFAPKAFRRPVEKPEVERLLAIYDQARKRGGSFDDAVKVALKGILVSPRFLFRVEVDQPNDQPYRISDYELASRLSYFLWSSMPDDELFSLAAQQRLSDPVVLDVEVRRMIHDPKAKALAENFAGQWLGIGNLETSAQPDPKRYPTYTSSLRDAMVREPIEVFHTILRENSSLLDLVDSDYTCLNEELARHYGINGVAGSQMRRVALTDRSRGGI